MSAFVRVFAAAALVCSLEAGTAAAQGGSLPVAEVTAPVDPLIEFEMRLREAFANELQVEHGRGAASRWRVAGQLAGAYLGGAAAGIGAWVLFDDPDGPGRRVKGDAGYTPDANTAYAAASFAGSTFAAYLIGRGDGSRGSLAYTALGSGVASALLLLGRHEPYLPLLGLIFGTPLQAGFATFGYQKVGR